MKHKKSYENSGVANSNPLNYSTQVWPFLAERTEVVKRRYISRKGNIRNQKITLQEVADRSSSSSRWISITSQSPPHWLMSDLLEWCMWWRVELQRDFSASGSRPGPPSAANPDRTAVRIKHRPSHSSFYCSLSHSVTALMSTPLSVSTAYLWALPISPFIFFSEQAGAGWTPFPLTLSPGVFCEGWKERLDDKARSCFWDWRGWMSLVSKNVWLKTFFFI